jgi:hypothetical protein
MSAEPQQGMTVRELRRMIRRERSSGSAAGAYVFVAVLLLLLVVSAMGLVGLDDQPAFLGTSLGQGGVSTAVVTPVDPGAQGMSTPSRRAPAKVLSLPAAAASRATVFIFSEPSGARVYLGERLIGQTNLQWEIPASAAQVTLRFELDGHHPAEQTFSPATERQLRVTLRPVPAPRPPVEAPPVAPSPEEKPAERSIYETL